MDPFTMPAEIVTLLQAAAAGAVPPAKRRRVRREERQEAYRAFQRDTYLMMTSVVQFNTYAQIKTITWKTGVVAAMPMMGTLLDLLQYELVKFLRSKKRREYTLLRDLEKRMTSAAALMQANNVMAAVSFADALGADTLLQYRITGDLGALRETTADFLASLARVRLIGRPGPVAAADVIRGALLELFSRMSAKKKTLPLSRRHQGVTNRGQHLPDFDMYLSVLVEANEQFLRAIQADRPVRRYRWQFWRPTQLRARQVPELLAQVGKRA